MSISISRGQIKIIKTLARKVAHLSDRATYEGFLSSCAGRAIASSTELSKPEANRVIDELQQLVGNQAPTSESRYQRYGGRPTNMNDEDRGRLLKKIEALLLDSRLHWAYADGIAKKMFRVDRVAWCKSDQLRRIIAALSYDWDRRQRRAKS